MGLKKGKRRRGEEERRGRGGDESMRAELRKRSGFLRQYVIYDSHTRGKQICELSICGSKRFVANTVAFKS